MVFNATSNNILVILWRLVLLVEETGVPGENHDLLQVTDKLYHIIFSVLARISKGQDATSEKGTFMRKRWLNIVVSSTPHLSGIRPHNISGDSH